MVNTIETIGAKIKVDFSGLAENKREAAWADIQKIYGDSTLRGRVETAISGQLTIQFGAVSGAAIARTDGNETAKPTITFDASQCELVLMAPCS